MNSSVRCNLDLVSYEWSSSSFLEKKALLDIFMDNTVHEEAIRGSKKSEWKRAYKDKLDPIGRDPPDLSLFAAKMDSSCMRW